jgi:hypothetical protein
MPLHIPEDDILHVSSVAIRTDHLFSLDSMDLMGAVLSEE